MTYLGSNPGAQLLRAAKVAQHRHAGHANLKQFHTEERRHVLRTTLQKHETDNAI